MLFASLLDDLPGQHHQPALLRAPQPLIRRMTGMAVALTAARMRGPAA